MPRHCKLVDPLKVKSIVKPFGVGSDGYPIFECIRLLMGTIDVENKRTAQNTKLRRCHVSQNQRSLVQGTLANLVAKIFDGDLSTGDFGEYLAKGGRENSVFWEEVKGELCLCLVAEKRKQHLHAFLHLYRVLELISIALPLVYASTEPDYKKSMKLLRSLTHNPRDGELAVFRNFTAHIARKGGYEKLLIGYDYSCSDEIWQKNASKQFESYVLDARKIGEIRTDYSGFDVKFSHVPLLLVNTRNRMFHRLLSGENFNLDELNGVDDICATVTRPTIYWLSLVIIEILKSHVKRFV